MPMTHLLEIGAKTGTRKPVPISDASDMLFGIEFFCYQILLTNRTCSIFVPVYMVPVFWYGFTAPISGMYVMDITVRDYASECRAA